MIGGRATGPGVFDMLAGIVQALHGLAALDDRSGVELLFTADEEVGSHASRELIEDRARACGAVLVIEPSAAVAYAAIFASPDRYHGRRIGVIISGGNVDLRRLAE